MSAAPLRWRAPSNSAHEQPDQCPQSEPLFRSQEPSPHASERKENGVGVRCTSLYSQEFPQPFPVHLRTYSPASPPLFPSRYPTLRCIASSYLLLQQGNPSDHGGLPFLVRGVFPLLLRTR